MPRKPRLHMPGGLYHVMLRGNGGQSIFPTDADRYRLFLLLQEGTARFGYRIHAFCLMTNHLHLALQVGEIPLSRAMQNLSFRYTGWINRRERRTGHLFQGRFKALLVDADSYLLELIRYIHLNPVRVGMVENPEDYRWSSHRAYLGREVYPWLTTDWVLGQFGARQNDARRRYADFVKEEVNGGARREFQSGITDGRVLGDDDFLEQVLSSAGETLPFKPTLDSLVEVVCRAYSLRPADLKSAGQRRSVTEARAVLGWLALETRGGTLTDVGKAVGRAGGTVSSAVRRLVQRAEEDKVLLDRMTTLNREIGILEA